MTAARTHRTLALPCALALTACGAPPPAPAPVAAAPATRPGVMFLDATEASGVDFVHESGAAGKRYMPEIMGAGGCVLDHDGDGRPDLYLVQSGPVPGSGSTAPRPPNRLFRNRGDGTFEDVTAGSGAEGAGYGMGATCADFDADGDTDIYLVDFGPNVLLRNDGGGRFTDVTARAGVGDPRWGSSAAFFDAEADGDLDLYVANYVEFTVATHVVCRERGQVEAYCHPDTYEATPDVFYRNRGDGTFEDATAEAGLVESTGKGLGVVVLDFDDDGDPDVYVTNDSTPNFLWRNDGLGRFEEVGLVQGVAYSEDGKTEAGMGVDAADVNGDLRLDLVVTNLNAEPNSLYLGGAHAFRHASRTAGIHQASLPRVGFGCDLLDLDNDADLDLFVANGHIIDNIAQVDAAQSFAQPGHVFTNDGTGRLALLDPARCGPPCEPHVGRGTMTWDADADGRLDLVVTECGRPARLYRNVASPAGRFVTLELLDGAPATHAIGARATVVAGGRSQVDELRAGSSYQTTSQPRLHFGLGAATVVERLIVRWRSGETTTHEGLGADRAYRIVRGAAPEVLAP
jgi:hypothetical protein